MKQAPRLRGRAGALPAITAMVAAIVPFLSPATASAQQGPPPPLPLGEVAFPDFQETTLSNGARLVVVTSDEVPLVTVNLVLPGGAAVDPAGKEGLASMVAQLLNQGTLERSNEDIAEAVDFLGASMGASASSDNVTVSVGAMTSALPDALEIMADVVMNPIFPDERLELLRTQNLSALQVQLSQAGAVAGRAFTRAVYGDHPYGKLETPESLQALTRADLVDYHARWFAPSSAFFVVAGDVTAERASQLLEDAFRGWSGDAPEVPAYPRVADRVGTEVILVHKPGSVQSEVRVGHLLEPGRHPDWTTLSVANRVLGGGATGRLFQVLREEKGYTYGAYSSVSRRRGQGAFQVSMAVRNEVTEEALTALFQEIDRMRDLLVPEDELRRNTDFMVGVFPLQIETPQQVAQRVTTNRLLGLPEDAIETYRARVAATDVDMVREVFRRHVSPAKAAVVVVGDATQVADQLRSFGPVRMVDVAGNPLDMAALAPQSASEAFSAESLEPMTLEYVLSFQGNAVGNTVRTLEATEEGTLRFTSSAQLGPQTIEQSVTVEPADLSFVSSEVNMTVQGQTMGGAVRREGERLVGRLTSPMGSTDVDLEVVPGLMVSDMLELAVWVTELEVGKELRLPLANLQAGTVENVTLTVVQETEITVPAGTFPVYEIRVAGSESQTLWARVEAPHVVLRLAPDAQPIVVELSSMTTGN